MSDVTRDAVAANPGAYLAGYQFSDAAGGAIPVPATLQDHIRKCNDVSFNFKCECHFAFQVRKQLQHSNVSNTLCF
jgi:hypothetical protein